MQILVNEIVALMECGRSDERIDRIEIHDCDIDRLRALQGSYAELLQDDIITILVDDEAIGDWNYLQDISGPVECNLRFTKELFLRKFSPLQDDNIGEYIF